MTELMKLACEFFQKNKIEYYAAVDYSILKEINVPLRQRAGFSPRTAVVFLIPYFVGKAKNFSSYATSNDYHIFVKELTRELASVMKNAFPTYNFRGFGDHSPIDERHAALVCGLGILGDSEMLINEKYGTYTFIAEILTDMPPEQAGAITPAEIKGCKSCGACRKACPTGRIGKMDVECLSDITQKKGELTDYEINLMRKVDTVWGCDLCQAVCPYNKSAEPTPIDFFYRDRVDFLSEQYISSLSPDEFENRAFAWRGKNTVIRNVRLLGYIEDEKTEAKR